MGIIELLLVLVDARVRRLLVAELDETTDEDLTVTNDSTERILAVEDVFERGAVGREGVDVVALRLGKSGQELRYPNGDVL